MTLQFYNRSDAGQQLASRLGEYSNRRDVTVLGLPRGGLTVAYEIAQVLKTQLEILIVRKLGMPSYEELAFGAIATGDITVFNEDLLNQLALSKQTIAHVIARERAELHRREQCYQGHQRLPVLCDRIVILVDDGIATGATMRAAIQVVRGQQPRAIIVAVPVLPLSTYQLLAPMVEQLVYISRPQTLYSISGWYRYFDQMSDAQVHDLLKQGSMLPTGSC